MIRTEDWTSTTSRQNLSTLSCTDEYSPQPTSYHLPSPNIPWKEILRICGHLNNVNHLQSQHISFKGIVRLSGHLNVENISWCLIDRSARFSWHHVNSGWCSFIFLSATALHHHSRGLERHSSERFEGYILVSDECNEWAQWCTSLFQRMRTFLSMDIGSLSIAYYLGRFLHFNSNLCLKILKWLWCDEDMSYVIHRCIHVEWSVYVLYNRMVYVVGDTVKEGHFCGTENVALFALLEKIH